MIGWPSQTDASISFGRMIVNAQGAGSHAAIFVEAVAKTSSDKRGSPIGRLRKYTTTLERPRTKSGKIRTNQGQDYAKRTGKQCLGSLKGDQFVQLGRSVNL
jgi:hypothetical protein